MTLLIGLPQSFGGLIRDVVLPHRHDHEDDYVDDDDDHHHHHGRGPAADYCEKDKHECD
jgi:hypothetical protein